MYPNVKSVLIASHNSGKVKEIRDLLQPFGVEVFDASGIGIEEPEETEPSFTGNALLKARAAAKASNKLSLGDDSGLCVNALGGQPGIYSARWAGPSRDFGVAMARVEQELLAIKASDYSAYFICVLALVWPEDANGEMKELVFEGKVHGHLRFPPKGNNGFGYDPIFVANGQKISFGEMDELNKNGMSHRTKAFEKLIAEVFAD
ncbi:MAG: dITP/XTP pyrophosphatase [Hyphomonadaceae bacterium]|nr:MAG: dITP/XTP pyrophosphatase [Hyphomonadaceae bacterium]